MALSIYEQVRGRVSPQVGMGVRIKTWTGFMP